MKNLFNYIKTKEYKNHPNYKLLLYSRYFILLIASGFLLSLGIITIVMIFGNPL